MIRSAVVVLCCLLSVGTASSASDSISFLGKSYTRDTWHKIRALIHCMTSVGSWVNEGHHVNLLYKNACNRQRYVQGKCAVDNLVSKSVGFDYAWRPDANCTAMANHAALNVGHYDREKFCQLLSNHTVFLMGDSLTEEYYMSVVSSLLKTDNECMGSTAYMKSHTAVPGPTHFEVLDTGKFSCGHSKVVNIRHDYFVVSEPGQHYPHTWPLGEQLWGAGWQHVLSPLKTDLLVVNRGAHFVEDHIVLDDLNKTLTYLTKTYGDSLSIIFRSTPPGHSDFEEKRYAAPLKNKAEARMELYNWNKFEHQNHAVREFLHEHFERVIYMDVYPSTVLRADGHATEEGLHYCLPGPIDQWTVFLYNILHILDAM